MTERPDEGKRADEPDSAGEDEDGGGINDPLTRRDVEAPRVPFQSGSQAGG